MNIYFKVVRTSNVGYFPVDLDWTAEEFIRRAKQWTLTTFGLDSVEFVDTVQFVPSWQAGEDAAALVPSTIRLRTIYGNQLHNLAFYVRPCVVVAPPSANAGDDGVVLDGGVGGAGEFDARVASDASGCLISDTNLCAICLSNPRNIVFIPCYHICACYQCGHNGSLVTCPICRRLIDDRIEVFL